MKNWFYRMWRHFTPLRYLIVYRSPLLNPKLNDRFSDGEVILGEPYGYVFYVARLKQHQICFQDGMAETCLRLAPEQFKLQPHKYFLEERNSIVKTTSIEAHCDTCPATATGTKHALEQIGWALHPKEQFCPKCNTE